MKITLFGFPGTGTSSAGQKLAEKLGYNFLSTGNMLRQEANELGLTINEFDLLCSRDSKYDLALDQKVAEYGKNNDNFIFDSRLAWYFIPYSIKIKLECDEGKTFKRIADREQKTITQVKEEVLDRQNKVADRYKRYYNLENYSDSQNFDLVIDTTNISLDEVVEKILDFVKNQNG